LILELPAVVAFSGRKGTGKSYHGQILVDQLGYVPTSFAAPLKRMVAHKNLITVEELEVNKAQYVTELQQTGVAYRELDENYWVNMWVAEAKGYLEQGKNVVVTDCRFENELAAVERLGGGTFRLWVPETIRQRRLIDVYGVYNPEDDKHISETNVDLLDVSAQIDGSVPPHMFVEYLQAVWNYQARRPENFVPFRKIDSSTGGLVRGRARSYEASSA
jgi:hypothetical protein